MTLVVILGGGDGGVYDDAEPPPPRPPSDTAPIPAHAALPARPRGWLPGFPAAPSQELAGNALTASSSVFESSSLALSALPGLEHSRPS
jgi:hypothetical protein